MSLGTTQVDYDYDNCGGTPDYSEGRLCSVIAKKGTTVSSKTAYANYDALGRVGKSTQTTGNQDYTMALRLRPGREPDLADLSLGEGGRDPL